MPRFRKGTNDHDGDGRKGGSMPGKSKAPAKAKIEARKEAVEEQFAAADAKADPAVAIEEATLGRQMRGW